MGVEGLVTLILVVLLIGVLLYAVNWACGVAGVPQPVRVCIMAVLGILFLLWILGHLGIGDVAVPSVEVED